MRIPSALTVVMVMVGLAGCGDSDTPEATPASPSATPSVAAPEPAARDELAGLAALALDRRYAARYTLDDGRGSPREVLVAVAQDGTWRVDIPGGALGGSAGVTIVRVPTGLYQCTLATVAMPVSPTCVRVAEGGDKVPRRYDPRVQRLFRQWLGVFTDSRAALAVSVVKPIAGAQGTCYAVDSVTASLDPPVDVGIYCYTPDGLLTAAQVDFGVVKLVSQKDGPATLGLPGPEVAGQPMPMTAGAQPGTPSGSVPTIRANG